MSVKSLEPSSDLERIERIRNAAVAAGNEVRDVNALVQALTSGHTTEAEIVSIEKLLNLERRTGGESRTEFNLYEGMGGRPTIGVDGSLPIDVATLPSGRRNPIHGRSDLCGMSAEEFLDMTKPKAHRAWTVGD